MKGICSFCGKTVSSRKERCMSCSNRQRIFTESMRKNYSNARLGKHHSEETKAKIAMQKGWHHTDETKKKIRNSINKSYQEKPELKENLRKINLGKKYSDETKKKLSEKTRFSNNPQWLGGKSYEPYGIEFNKELKKKIKNRDKRCMLCHIGFEYLKLLEIKVDIHHIDYNKRNNFPQNLISLCRKCHLITNHSRDEWKIFFRKIMFKEYKYEYSDDKIILDLMEMV